MSETAEVEGMIFRLNDAGTFDRVRFSAEPVEALVLDPETEQWVKVVITMERA